MKALNRRSLGVVVFTGLLIVIVNFVWWLFYFQTEASFENQLSRRLSSLAVLGAKSFEPEDVSGLVGGRLNAYEKTLDKIENIRQSDSLSEVFVIDVDFHYLASTALDNDSVYYLASLNRDAIESALYGTSGSISEGDRSYTSVPASYRSGNVILKSAFAPLVDSMGLVSAVLGLEADVDYADDLFGLRRSLIISTGLSVGIGILFGMIFFIIQRRIGRAERSIFLSQSQANLGQMVAVVSHEIKNPLMIIRASAESLKKKTASPESDFILEEIDRLNKIVTGYLDFASGKMILKKETVDIGKLVSEIIEKFAPRLKEKNIFLDTKTSDNKVLAQADRIAIRQVIINLLLNASDAVADVSNPEIIIDYANNKNQVCIKVRDNGPGVDAKILKNLFEPFYTTKTSGSGLGLFHSRRLVEEMNGKLEVRISEDNINEFRVFIPEATMGD